MDSGRCDFGTRKAAPRRTIEPPRGGLVAHAALRQARGARHLMNPTKAIDKVYIDWTLDMARAGTYIHDPELKNTTWAGSVMRNSAFQPSNSIQPHGSGRRIAPAATTGAWSFVYVFFTNGIPFDSPNRSEPCPAA